MRIRFRPFVVLLFVFLVCGPAVYAQGGVRSGPDPSTIRDPDLEKDSLHNLEVARHYFKLKKAYVAAIKRCEEMLDWSRGSRVMAANIGMPVTNA